MIQRLLTSIERSNRSRYEGCNSPHTLGLRRRLLTFRQNGTPVRQGQPRHPCGLVELPACQAKSRASFLTSAHVIGAQAEAVPPLNGTLLIGRSHFQPVYASRDGRRPNKPGQAKSR